MIDTMGPLNQKVLKIERFTRVRKLMIKLKGWHEEMWDRFWIGWERNTFSDWMVVGILAGAILMVVLPIINAFMSIR